MQSANTETYSCRYCVKTFTNGLQRKHHEWNHSAVFEMKESLMYQELLKRIDALEQQVRELAERSQLKPFPL